MLYVFSMLLTNYRADLHLCISHVYIRHQIIRFIQRIALYVTHIVLLLEPRILSLVLSTYLLSQQIRVIEI